MAMVTIHTVILDGTGTPLGVQVEVVQYMGVHMGTGMHMFNDDEGVYYVHPHHLLGMEVHTQ